MSKENDDLGAPSMDTMLTSEELSRIYSVLRSEFEGFSVQAIRFYFGAAGFDVTRIPVGLSAEVMPKVDQLFREMKPELQLNALVILVERLNEHNSVAAANVLALLRKHGIQFLNRAFVPVGILDARERQYLPLSAASNLERAMERLGNADYSGAITSACGAVDAVTAAIYEQKSLGDPGKESFRAKVDKVLNELNTFEEMEADLVTQGLQASDAKRVVENMRKATQHAAEVLQIFRRDPGDAHGTKPATRKTAYDAIKWASAICGLLEGKV